MIVIDGDTGQVLVEESGGDLVMRADGFEFRPTGLVVTGDPAFEIYEAVGRWLQRIEAAVQWWIGDWLNYGERRWGETFAQAADQTSYTEGSLANMKWVAGRVDPSSRNEDLSYSHHVAVAPLPPDEQEAWLEKANRDGLSVRELRKAIRRPRLPSGDGGAMTGEIDHASLTVTLWPRSQGEITEVIDRLGDMVEWK